MYSTFNPEHDVNAQPEKVRLCWSETVSIFKSCCGFMCRFLCSKPSSSRIFHHFENMKCNNEISCWTLETDLGSDRRPVGCRQTFERFPLEVGNRNIFGGEHGDTFGKLLSYKPFIYVPWPQWRSYQTWINIYTLVPTFLWAETNPVADCPDRLCGFCSDPVLIFSSELCVCLQTAALSSHSAE